jgi:hypothetical protein
MDYEMLVHQIRRHVKYVYDYRIRYNLRANAGKPFFVERRNIISKAIPAMSGDMDMFEILVEKMYEDGYIIKDDGHTLIFSESFVFD